MKKLSLALIATLTCFSAEPKKPVEPPKEIRLLVAKRKGALVESRGHYRIYDTLKEEPLAFASRGERFWVEARNEGLRLGDKLLKIKQVVFIPQDKKSTLLVDGIQYGGALAVYLQEDKIFCVNEVSLEDYVISVLSNKLDHRPQSEALCALAIVERTRGAYFVEAGQGKNWHADAREVGYSGYGSTQKKLGVEEAAVATRSFVLHSTKSSAPLFGFDAAWCAHSAGALAPLKTVAKRVGFDESVYTTSAFAKKNASEAQWSYRFDKKALAEALHVDGIEAIELVCEPKSSKVSSLRIRDDESKTHELEFIAFQKIFGHEFIQSNNFQVEKADKKGVTLKGVGAGLGSGLCLYSAEQMSLLGQDAKEILATFFPKAEVEKIGALAKKQENKTPASVNTPI